MFWKHKSNNAMEIEAKFSVPDIEIYNQLKQMDHLAGFELSASKEKQVIDTYVDTDDRLILNAGYGCRKRVQPDGLLVTLKGLGTIDGAVHRREEWEVLLTTDQPPTHWPDSPVRERVKQIIGGAALQPLVQLAQTRIVQFIYQDQRRMAELSLDSVRLAVQGKEQAYFELEIELIPPESEALLVNLVSTLQQNFHLQPETRSKFERALSFIDTYS
ncbi:MAG: CYTH domain-containing protein [Chloroflexota bacterium]